MGSNPISGTKLKNKDLFDSKWEKRSRIVG